MFVCLDQLCNNKLVGNKSSSLIHMHMFMAKEGRVNRTSAGPSKTCNNEELMPNVEDPASPYTGCAGVLNI